MAAANDDGPYDLHQRILSKQLGEKLNTMAGKLKPDICNHAIAAAFIGTGLAADIEEYGTAGAADWLRGVANAVENKQDPYDAHSVN